MRIVCLMGLVGALGGCGAQTASPGPPANGASSVDLSALLPPDAALVGLAIAPDGRRYVLDQRSGLYEVGDGSATLVFNTTGLSGVELTDVVALDNERFALTAPNDGFLLNARTHEFTSYFCYLPPLPPDVPEQPPTGSAGGPAQPPEMPVSNPLSVSQTLQLQGVAVQQRTESVAYNTATRQLFAQPRTIRLDTGAIAGSELFVFGESGGEPIRVFPFAEATFVAGGMAATTGERLIVGAVSVLYEVSPAGELRHLRRLDSSINIAGMARAPDGVLWLLDSAERRLLGLDSSVWN